MKKCSSLRGSVLMIGPLLGRFGKATIAKPGGDKIWLVVVWIPTSLASRILVHNFWLVLKTVNVYEIPG